MFTSFSFIMLQATLTILESLIDSVAEQGAIATIFIVICYYLVNQLKGKDKQLEAKDKQLDGKDEQVAELNEYIRESEKETVQVLNAVNNTLDKVLENQKNSNNMVIKEIENLKEYISLKLNK
jgi:septal ring factor EnvC (AmiA/AmiB activator)